MGWIMTIILGIVGAFLARFVGQMVGFYGPDENAGFIAAVIGLLDLVLQLILVRGLPKIFTGS